MNREATIEAVRNLFERPGTPGEKAAAWEALKRLQHPAERDDHRERIVARLMQYDAGQVSHAQMVRELKRYNDKHFKLR